MTDREIMQMALEALEEFCEHQTMLRPIEKRDALRERLAQPLYTAPPEQKPVAVIKRNEAGQITMQTPDGNPFDMSKYIGASLYTGPLKQEPVAWLSTDSIGERYLWFSKPLDNDKAQPLYTAPQKRKPLTDEEKLIDLLEAARETFKKSPSGSECSQNAAYVHSVLETMLIKREWQGLTDEEISAISKSIPGETDLGAAKRLFARAIEAKLKEKNT